MLRIVESTKRLELIAAALEAAVARHKFGVLGVYDLKAKMAEKGVPFARDCRIFEVCNPHQAKKVLEANLEVATALPCRIAIYEEGGKTKLATIKPTAMLALYSTPELQGVAEEVEATLAAIMAEAAARHSRVAGEVHDGDQRSTESLPPTAGLSVASHPGSARGAHGRGLAARGRPHEHPGDGRGRGAFRRAARGVSPRRRHGARGDERDALQCLSGWRFKHRCRGRFLSVPPVTMRGGTALRPDDAPRGQACSGCAGPARSFPTACGGGRARIPVGDVFGLAAVLAAPSIAVPGGL
jgi:uncharacterized protein (DUF302 family)